MSPDADLPGLRLVLFDNRKLVDKATKARTSVMSEIEASLIAYSFQFDEVFQGTHIDLDPNVPRKTRWFFTIQFDPFPPMGLIVNYHSSACLSFMSANSLDSGRYCPCNFGIISDMAFKSVDHR
jgi:hypothetical protein